MGEGKLPQEAPPEPLWKKVSIFSKNGSGSRFGYVEKADMACSRQGCSKYSPGARAEKSQNNVLALSPLCNASSTTRERPQVKL